MRGQNSFNLITHKTTTFKRRVIIFLCANFFNRPCKKITGNQKEELNGKCAVLKKIYAVA